MPAPDVKSVNPGALVFTHIDTGIDGRIPYEMDMPSTTRLRSRSDVAKASIQVL